MNKYHAKKVKVDGMTFDSKREYARWKDLQLLQRAGKIQDLRRQVRFQLCETPYDEAGFALFRGVFYKADFVYIENGKTIVEDCKGFRTDAYLIKKKWFYDKYGILIRET